MGTLYYWEHHKGRESSTACYKIHFKSELEVWPKLSRASFKIKSTTAFLLARDKRPRPVIRATRNSSPSELLVPNCRTKLFQTSYFNRIPKLWNALPSSTRCLTSVKQFKLLLHKRYFNALQTSFNVDNPNTWKSVCTKCCAQRDILSSKICCY